jgi:hypothetical protein
VVLGIAETVSVSLNKYIELMKRRENITKKKLKEILMFAPKRKL